MSEVSIATASSARRNGATSRVESRWSRSTRAARTWATIDLLAPRLQLSGAARRAHVRPRRQEDLDLRVGKDVGADVAALHHDVDVARQGALLIDQHTPDAGQSGDERGRGAGVQRADGGAHVTLADEEPPVAAETQRGGESDGHDGGLVVERHTGLSSQKADRPVHGAGVQVDVAKPGGHGARHRALA